MLQDDDLSVIRLLSGTAARIYWRAADAGTDYVEWDAAQNRIGIFEDGALRREIEFFFYPDQPFECRVEVQAGRLYVYVNHHHWLDVATSAGLDGKFGLGTRGGAASFDDVLVMDALFHDERPILRLPYAAGQALVVGNLFTAGHRGVDFGWTTGAEDFHGPMPASAAGLVTYVLFTNQSIITLYHGHGYETRYVHADQIYVDVGQQVPAGHTLGWIGRWGSHWDHVHFELFRHGEVLRPAVLSGYRDFCLYSACGQWYTSDNAPGLPQRVGVVRKSETSSLPGFVHWRDDFTGWIIDQKMPLPAWSGLDTQQQVVHSDESIGNRVAGKQISSSAFEENGWLRIPGSAQISAWLRTREYYTRALVRARVRLDDALPVDGCSRANLELRFRESDDGGPRDGDGDGYALVLDAHNNTVELRQANSAERIGGLYVNHPINAGTVFYLHVDADDARTPNLRIRVGLSEGAADVVDWSIDDRQHAAGCIRMANRCARQVAWDWIEVSGDAFDPHSPPEPLSQADFDRDGDVDQTDFGHLQQCLTGTGVVQTDPGCLNADLDGDGDVDLTDFDLFRQCMSGANVPADPDCP